MTTDKAPRLQVPAPDARLTIKDRAEDMTSEELRIIAEKPSLTNVVNSVTRWLLYPWTKQPRVLAGPKGIGKTFAAMEAVRGLVEKGHKPPIYYVYKRQGKVEDIGTKFGETQGDWAYIFDDVHYLSEAVSKGEVEAKELVSLMRTAVEKAKSGKAVLVISEDLPSVYFRDLQIKKLESLDDKFKDIMLVDPPTFDDWFKLLETFKVESWDTAGAQLIYQLSTKPRFLVRVANLAGSLMLSNLLDCARKLLQEKAQTGTNRDKQKKLALDAVLQLFQRQPMPPMSFRQSMVLEEVLGLGEKTLAKINDRLNLMRIIAEKAAARLKANPNYYQQSQRFRRTDDIFAINSADKVERVKVINDIIGELKATEPSLFRSGLTTLSNYYTEELFLNYCAKDYERTHLMLQRLTEFYTTSELKIMQRRSRFSRVAGGWVAIEPFNAAFGHFHEIESGEIILRMLDIARLEADAARVDVKWHSLFTYAKERVDPAKFDEAFLLALRRGFREAAEEEISGLGWRKRLIEEAGSGQPRVEPD